MSKRDALRGSTAVKFALGVVGGLLAATPAAWAQAVEAVQDEIIVTATKRGDVLAQDVPIAITAFSSEQLEALNFTSLQSLTYTMPNVQLEDVGTAPGVANFSIRGLGINSSIPSVDPTVGVFVDGMYYGINSGLVLDNFDLEAVEVLRGPQGTLYGRNVTGGAVLIRTTTPDDDLHITARAAYETGPEYRTDFTISGPLAPGLLSAKLAVFRDHDDGWFENDYDGSQFGFAETNIYRGALRFTPTENFEAILRVESGNSESDGPAGQNHALYDRGSFDFAIDYPGFASGDWEQAILKTNLDVAFGDGTITNIWGWRDSEGRSGSDIDATTGFGFHARAVNLQDQMSDELRYTGTFGNFDVTTGLYWFQQNLLYIEERAIAGGAVFRVGGGDGTFSTKAAFANVDWHLNDQWTLNFGVRYTQEAKEARVSRIRGSTNNLDGAVVVPGEFQVGGSIDDGTLNFSDHPFYLHWTDTSPRVGIQWEPNDDTNVYAFWAQGFRSGGVNFRTTTLGSGAGPLSGAPQAFDAEEQSSFEVGWKQDFAERRGRFNLAVFHNTIDDMQRETNVPDPAGVQQVIVNAGTAVIYGAEIEARWFFTPQFMVSAQVGYTHGEYDSVTADLDNNGIVDGDDKDQEIPRLAPWSYGVNVIYDLPIFNGTLSSRVGYNHRDEAYYNDTNQGILAEADIFDANFTWRPTDGNWSIAIYGENLTDEATWGNDTILPDSALFGGDGAGPRPLPTFSPLNEGRVVGAEIRYHY